MKPHSPDTHPSSESLVAHLYGETDPTWSRTEIQNHLRQCSACRRQMDQWSEVQYALDGSNPPTEIRFRHLSFPTWMTKAAMAASILALGIISGWLSRGIVDHQDLRLVQQQIDAMELKLQKEFAVEVARQQENSARLLQTVVDRIQQQNDAAWDELRTDVETIAWNTAVTFRAAESQLSRIASTAPDSSTSEPYTTP